MNEKQANALKVLIKAECPHVDVIVAGDGAPDYTYYLTVYWIGHAQITIRNEQQWNERAFLFLLR